ncbi:MAG: DUF2244 domain-containing protein [Xanthomonadales bacterium]|nr:DUF2244 domain-containing protein [Gammaproteobacteria bacterium]MBT8054985.1 DUF2244 domain-containing protein [Gammaproteobacteria bacterium]NND56367.1 DUF2244 domain-containing protein [Xanthomonadales bacterium]NNK50424.1 DUF2244 domain-containing protein [Xanthomonadales bacterium]
MIVSWQSSDSSKANILARGNFSLDASGMVNLLLALAAVSLLLAGLLTLQGYWPILLIAGVQLVLVCWILIRAWEQAWVSEVIEITEDKIRVTHQRHKQKRLYEFETAWAVIEWKQPEVAWYEPRMQLRSRAQVVELGSFLTGSEKHQLAKCLQSAVEKHSAMKGAIIS